MVVLIRIPSRDREVAIYVYSLQYCVRRCADWCVRCL